MKKLLAFLCAILCTILTIQATETETVVLLDSIIRLEKDNSRCGEFYEYDDAGNTIVYSATSFNSNGEKKDLLRYDYEYNSSNQKTSEIYSTNVNNVFSLVTKQLYTYSADKVASISTSNWRNDQWKDTLLTKYEYTADGLISRETLQKNAGTTWLNVSKQEYEYDNNGKKQRLLQYTYAYDQWVNNYITEYEYNENGDIATIINSSYGKYFSKEEYSYSSTDIDSSMTCTRYQYSYTKQEFEPQTKYTITYDLNGNEILITDSICIGSVPPKWVFDSKIEMFYNEDNQIEEINYQTYKNVYAYDENGNRQTITQYNYDDIYHQWVYVNITTYYYSEKTITVLAIEQSTYTQKPFDMNSPTFDLVGNMVNPVNYKGVVIQNGQKYLIK